MSTEETKKVLAEENAKAAVSAQELDDENLDEITGGVLPKKYPTRQCKICGRTLPIFQMVNDSVCIRCSDESPKKGVIVLV